MASSRGWDETSRTYDETTWQYESSDAGDDGGSGGGRHGEAATGETHGSGGADPATDAHPAQDPTLQHPRCVFQLLKKHYRGTRRRWWRRCAACRAEQFLEVAEALCENSGRERTGAFCYAVGWTQHSVGVQYIRTAAIVQLLLGNIGRPGGGILALRGHASIQGSTDIPTLYNLLPGYLPMPQAEQRHASRATSRANGPKTGFWGHFPAYVVSLLKAYWGDAATAENDFGFDWLPRITGDHSHYQTVQGMLDGRGQRVARPR